MNVYIAAAVLWVHVFNFGDYKQAMLFPVAPFEYEACYFDRDETRATEARFDTSCYDEKGNLVYWGLAYKVGKPL